MLTNYHTHTWRCHHATGTEEDYVNHAIQGGMRTLGFSDHTPYFFPGDYYSNFRMFPQQLEDYCNTVQKLKNDYVNQIQIHLGLEVEFYPTLFPRLLEYLRDYPIEYMLLGQHFIGDEMNEPYSGRPTENEEILKAYCHQVMDAMQTGLFTYLAHPDLLWFVGDDAVYRKHMTQLCREAKSCGMVLEINGVGLRSGRNYPDLRFWEIAGQEGCQVLFGCDAHAPEHVCDLESYEKAQKIAAHCGLTLLNDVPLRPIR